MTKKIHDFKESLKRGNAAAEHLALVFRNMGRVYLHGEQWLVVEASQQHDRKQGVDAIHIDNQDCRIIHRVDYKLDSQATKYAWSEAVGPEGQLTLEDHHVYDDGRRTKGWVHTSKADRIISYVPQLEIAYCLILERIRQSWDRVSLHGLNQVRNQQWTTFNYYVPVKTLRYWEIIERTVSTAAHEPARSENQTPNFPPNPYLLAYLKEKREGGTNG